VDVYLRLGQLYFTCVPGSIAGLFDFLLVDLGIFLRDIAVTAAQLVLVIFDGTGLLSVLQPPICSMLSLRMSELLPLFALGFRGGRLEGLSLVVPFALATQRLCLRRLEGFSRFRT
jgi:hypothetical protein